MPKGVLYMLLAVAVYAVINSLVKYLPNIPVVEIILFRSVITLAICISMLRAQNVPLFGHNKTLLVGRGIFGTIGLTMYFITLQNMPLASSIVIHYTAPIFTVLIAYFFLKEKLYTWQWFFFILSFVGVVITKGFDNRVSLLMMSLGIIGALFSGFAYNCIRALKQTEHPLVIILYFPLIALPVSLVFCFSQWVTPTLNETILLVIIGVLTQAAQYFMTKAYQAENAAIISNINYLGIVWALGIGYFVFDESFGLWPIIGMCIVMLAVFFNIFYVQYKKKHA